MLTPANKPRFPELQLLFQTAVLSSDPLARHRLADELNAAIAPSPSLSPLERLEVYRSMYPLRCEALLADDYPALREAMGDDEFIALTHAYAYAHPSRSFTMARFGERLPDFIAAHTGMSAKRRGFLADLARVELAVSQVREAPDAPVLSIDQINAIPSQRWPSVRLQASPAVRYLSLNHPINLTYEAFLADEPLLPIRPQPAWLLVYRKDQRVHRLAIGRRAHCLLEALLAGLPLGRALEESLSIHDGRDVQERVFTWLREWVSEGLFQAAL